MAKTRYQLCLTLLAFHDGVLDPQPLIELPIGDQVAAKDLKYTQIRNAIEAFLFETATRGRLEWMTDAAEEYEQEHA